MDSVAGVAALEAAARRAAGERVIRTIRHWYHGLRGARAAFPAAVRASIEREIGESERQHRGEICFAIEAALPMGSLARGVSARQSALAAFATLGVWDTEANNGVLIYVLLADHSVELVADRGIASRIADSEWQALCAEVETCFRRGEFEKGSLLGVRGVAQRLAQHFPAAASRANELPNQPVLL